MPNRPGMTVASRAMMTPSSPEVGARMSAQPRRDTAAELALRRSLHRRGLRYRVDLPIAPGHRRRVDIAFTSLKVAVFVDGCFWHGCPLHGTRPRSNGDWWAQKLDRNMAGDRETNVLMHEANWTVVRVWEHRDPESVADETEALVRRRRGLFAVRAIPGGA